MLFSDKHRVVLEVDGRLYAEMVAEDRRRRDR